MDFEQARFNMVEQQIRPWDVLDFDLLDALAEIPREHFVDEAQKPYAYADTALPLPNGASMLEPKIVARLIQGLALKPAETVLEIGTGSGYATAVLAKLAAQVVTMDTDREQSARAQVVLDCLGLPNIRFEHGDGLSTPTAAAPYDAVYVGGALKSVPETLKQQLRDGGRLAVIVGNAPVQRALLITRNGSVFEEKVLFDTFVSYLNSPADTAATRFTF
ncbi:protein-L-isoaspartate O-methyltransferase [Neisseria leonii]|uniref:Protein-L-isoaspartate O-methyltransferase n=1 Tax=Neisseria leonii TaxID=2995413 RepID=A0A9X4E102_9NEIS|nr:protein-L-isoaspartate O-methyltransferase [Neisseria sp. 51.81]MDD9327485.1 protein-L-isoaspartate O-methyltransferase [Neisseria sp. 51.81]